MLFAASAIHYGKTAHAADAKAAKVANNTKKWANTAARRKKTAATKNKSIFIWSFAHFFVPLQPHSEKRSFDLWSSHLRSEELMRASLFIRSNGALDEWLSQRSAKPSTAVRIRQAPPKAGISQQRFPLFLFHNSPTLYTPPCSRAQSSTPLLAFFNWHKSIK